MSLDEFFNRINEALSSPASAVQNSQPAQNSQTTQNAQNENVNSVWEKDENYSSYTRQDVRENERKGDDDPDVRTYPFNSQAENPLQLYINAVYGKGTPMTDGERYAAEKEVLDANREELMPAINELYLFKQEYDDLVQGLAQYNIETSDLTDDEQDALIDALGSIAAGNSVDFSRITLSGEVKSVLEDIQEKHQKNQYDQFSLDENVDKIPQEYIEGADYSTVNAKELKYHTINTMTVEDDKNADGKIKTDILFNVDQNNKHVSVDSETGEIVIDFTDIDFSNMTPEQAQQAIQNRIGEVYGLSDTDGNGRISLDSEAGSAIADTIARSEGNNEVFDNYDVGNSSVDKFAQEIYNYGLKNGFDKLKLTTQNVDYSSLDINTTRADLMREGNEVRFTQLHVTEDSVKIGEDVKKGIDVLEFVEYGDSNLKEVLQNATINEGLNLLSSDEFSGKSYSEVMDILEYTDKAGYSELRNNLRLLEDKFGDSANLQEAVAQARASVPKNTESLASIRELAAAALRQELGNNPAFQDLLTDNQNDNIDRLFNYSLMGKGVDVFMLEDANFTIQMPKYQASVEPTPSKPEPSIPTPSIPEPSTPDPSIPTPSIPTPSIPTPSIPLPSVPTPSIPTPSIPQPSIPTPSIPEPSTPEPSLEPSCPPPPVVSVPDPPAPSTEPSCPPPPVVSVTPDISIPTPEISIPIPDISEPTLPPDVTDPVTSELPPDAGDDDVDFDDDPTPSTAPVPSTVPTPSIVEPSIPEPVPSVVEPSIPDPTPSTPEPGPSCDLPPEISFDDHVAPDEPEPEQQVSTPAPEPMTSTPAPEPMVSAPTPQEPEPIDEPQIPGGETEEGGTDAGDGDADFEGEDEQPQDQQQEEQQQQPDEPAEPDVPPADEPAEPDVPTAEEPADEPPAEEPAGDQSEDQYVDAGDGDVDF